MTDTTRIEPADDMPPAPPVRSTRLLAVGVLVIVALAGVMGGVALDRVVLRPRSAEWRGGPPRGGERSRTPRRPSAMLGAELKLTEEQAVRIDTLIENQMRGFREIRRSTQPAVDSLMAQTRRAIDSILTPAQRVQLDSVRARREAEFRKRYPNGAPSRGAPGSRGGGPMRLP
jgi:Spy/CpxP family protein refolding chaperone